ncbi:MAG: DUF4190 domain-containing protein [Anaerolineales bacterium]|nr:DUF4190 domain-containing protein [Anaerolineales bacterium]
MAEQVPPQVVSGDTPGDSKKGFAIASLVVGIINLCAWLLPICGGPLAVVGIVLGVLGIQSSQRTLAIVGIVLSGLTLLLAILNAVAGVLFGPQITDMFNQIQSELY